ncbi:MAG: hypothetical protein F7C34_02375 [Desulfurococcales archaeon]|nr:hypothetical protein [Desulfurococcales archaeon]
MPPFRVTAVPVVLSQSGDHLLVAAVECSARAPEGCDLDLEGVVLSALKRGVPAGSLEEALGLALVYGGVVLLYRAGNGYVPVSRAITGERFAIQPSDSAPSLGLADSLGLIAGLISGKGLPREGLPGVLCGGQPVRLVPSAEGDCRLAPVGVSYG